MGGSIGKGQKKRSNSTNRADGISHYTIPYIHFTFKSYTLRHLKVERICEKMNIGLNSSEIFSDWNQRQI